MTEHGAGHIERYGPDFRIGNSSLHWDDDRLTIYIDEVCTPFPRRIRGTVTVQTNGLGRSAFLIDDRGRHRWRPLSPVSRVRVDIDQPELRWSGDGYLDCNEGDEPLQDAFSFWDWSRTIVDRKKTAILYNTDMVNGSSRLSAFLVDRHGEVEEIETPAPAPLPRTPVWQIKRRTRSDGGERPKVIRTLEDTPFYSRSEIETTLFGARRRAIHESLSGPRLKSPIVQFMLGYRMPRKP